MRVGIALMLDQDQLVDAPIGLAQLYTELLGQPLADCESCRRAAPGGFSRGGRKGR